VTATAPWDGGPGGDPAGSRAAFWVVGLSVAVAAHAGAVSLALRAPRDELPAPAPAPVVMLELAPEPAAPPSPETYIADSLDQPDPLAEFETPQPLDEPPPPVEPPPDVETPVADTLPEIEPLPDLPPAEVAEPRPVRRPENLRVEKPIEPAKEAPKPERKAPPPQVASRVAAPEKAEKAETAKAPETVSARGSSVSPARWQSQLMAHLERRKRYPSAARGRREEGTVQVRFSIDDGGNVLSSRIVRSSGHAALDQAVLDLMARASPVPAPPAGAPRTITAPVRFSIR
jgi:periplasmic protein TonB